ncbi:MAG: hypothetical protein ACLFVO_16325 [Chloroflexaceae bacterium]
MNTATDAPNSLMQETYPALQLIQPLREQLLELLTDDDLAFALPGNPTLGSLCRELAEVQAGYTQSFRTFTMTNGPHTDRPDIAQQVAALAAWYHTLDQELAATLAALSEADIHERVIERPGFAVPPSTNLHLYREALFIFYGKVTVYLNALGKPLPPQWATWIG